MAKKRKMENQMVTLTEMARVSFQKEIKVY